MRTTNERCPTVTATATTVVNTESDCAKAAKRTRGHALQRAVICVVAPRRDDLYALAYVCWAQRMPRRSSVRPVGRVAFRSGAEIRPLTHVITITEWLTQRLLTLTVPNAFMCGSEECIQYSYLSLLFTPRHKRWKYVHNCISHLEVAATVVHRVQRITPPRNTVFVFGLSSWTANCCLAAVGGMKDGRSAFELDYLRFIFSAVYFLLLSNIVWLSVNFTLFL